MALWGKHDNEPSKPKFLTAEEKALVQLITNEGAIDEDNIEKGLTTPGWAIYSTYEDSNGNTRHKAETLVAFSVSAAEAAAYAPVLVEMPEITGDDFIEGTELSVSEGLWESEDEPVFTYQWLKDGEEIENETNSTYTLLAGDDGSLISVVVTATNDTGATSVTTAEVGPVIAKYAPILVEMPEVTGVDFVVGTELSVSEGDWDSLDVPVITYQWLKDGVEIENETSATYTLLVGDVDGLISVNVTATNDTGATSVTTDAVGPVVAAPYAPVLVDMPVVTGDDFVVGTVLTVSEGDWDSETAPVFTYQWLKDGVDIENETGTTYTLLVGDVGGLISVTVTATNPVGPTSVTTAAVGPVVAA